MDELMREKEDLDMNDHDTYLRFEERIEKIQDRIDENEKDLAEEIKNNEYELQINIGKKITYG